VSDAWVARLCITSAARVPCADQWQRLNTVVSMACGVCERVRPTNSGHGPILLKLKSTIPKTRTIQSGCDAGQIACVVSRTRKIAHLSIENNNRSLTGGHDSVWWALHPVFSTERSELCFINRPSSWDADGRIGGERLNLKSRQFSLRWLLLLVTLIAVGVASPGLYRAAFFLLAGVCLVLFSYRAIRYLVRSPTGRMKG